MLSRYHILMGFMQGLLLLLLHEGMVHEWGVVIAPEFAFPAYTMVLLLPIMTMLCIQFSDRAALLRLLVAGSIVFLILGVCSGSMAFSPVDKNSFNGIFVFALAMLALFYIGLPFIQSWMRAGSWHFSYKDLYEFGWLNTQTLIMGGLFTGLVWAILGLCGALFKLISISLFADMFSDVYFIYPTTGMMFAYGVSLGMQHFDIKNVHKTDFFFRFVTLLIALVAVLFLMGLTVSGLQPLWDTRYATFLLLWLQVFVVLFVNGLFQYGYQQRDEPGWVRWSISVALLAMPAFSLICVYAMSLRVEQYGWTEDRVWASLAIAILTIYVLGYAAAALRGLMGKGDWLAWLMPSNIIAACTIVCVAALTSLPFFSPVHIAVESQVSRLLSGQVKANAFDFDYLRFEAGRVGLEKLDILMNVEGLEQSALIRKYAETARNKVKRWGPVNPIDGIEKPDVAKYFTVYPEGHGLDASSVKFFYENRKSMFNECFSAVAPCKVLYINLNDDALDEMIVFEDAFSWKTLYAKRHNKWQRAGYIEETSGSRVGQEVLNIKDVEAVNSSWKRLRIGDRFFDVK